MPKVTRFNSEKDFEDALVNILKNKGWPVVLDYYDEQKLKQNFADIVFKNNRGMGKLNNVPLCSDEIDELIHQFDGKAPYEINGLLLGGSLSLKRSNSKDEVNCGKYVELDIFFPQDVGEGKNVYQIARQPIFTKQSPEQKNRRGDFSLLINGLPVVHVELKTSNKGFEDGINQIETYLRLGLFSGIFSTIQLFVSMTPEESRYFANPGTQHPEVNRKFAFAWADFNNQKQDDWKSMAENMLSIPQAHRMVAYYTIADRAREILKVMRSYQCHAAQIIRDRAVKVRSSAYKENHQLGGYIWHTTGSGKTMTSFKSAQLISDANFADNVLFVLDRIELGNQSRDEYNNFGGKLGNTVSFTEDTSELEEALRGGKTKDRLIVTSIQKLNRLVSDPKNNPLLDKLKDKKIVFIFDECHRSTFGDSFPDIRRKFPSGVFFGFTGTPIKKENSIYDTTTQDQFGEQLHFYSLGDGIRDGNVLPFDCTPVLTISDDELREKVALLKARSATREEALKDKKKRETYNYYMDKSQVSLVELEKNLVPGNFGQSHKEKVVRDILDNFDRISVNRKFHAIMATSSIEDAISYYRLFINKREDDSFRVTAVFDPNLEYSQSGKHNASKAQAMEEIIANYNQTFGTHFGQQPSFKQDVIHRLSHKRGTAPWPINETSDDRLDLVIVVDQLLTGFDSLWLNTLFVDKELDFHSLVQAFSRTNRILDDDKIYGQIRYYRKPHTIKENIEKAVDLYSGQHAPDVFAPKIKKVVEEINHTYEGIKALFKNSNVSDFSKLPANDASIRKFSHLFGRLVKFIKCAKLQGFDWEDKSIKTQDETTGEPIEICRPEISKEIFDVLALRYKSISQIGGRGPRPPTVPLNLSYVTNVQTSEQINKDYVNQKFQRFLVDIQQKNISEKELEDLFNKFHSEIKTLSEEDQHYAEVIISQIQKGKLQLQTGANFMELVNQLKVTKQNDVFSSFVQTFGIDEKALRKKINTYIPGENIDKLGEFEAIANSANESKILAFIQKFTDKPIYGYMARTLFREVLRKFIEQEGQLDITKIDLSNEIAEYF